MLSQANRRLPLCHLDLFRGLDNIIAPHHRPVGQYSYETYDIHCTGIRSPGVHEDGVHGTSCHILPTNSMGYARHTCLLQPSLYTLQDDCISSNYPITSLKAETVLEQPFKGRESVFDQSFSLPC